MVYGIRNGFKVYFEACDHDQRFVNIYTEYKGKVSMCEDMYRQTKFRNKEPEHFEAAYLLYKQFYDEHHGKQK